MSDAELEAKKKLAYAELESEERTFLIACGWEHVGPDLWRPGEAHAPNIRSRYDEGVTQGHAVNVQKGIDGIRRFWSRIARSRSVREHDVVALVMSLNDPLLAAGTKGTVVHVYPTESKCEVEFVTGLGSKVVTLDLGMVIATTG